jgi:hypothetical protein
MGRYVRRSRSPRTTKQSPAEPPPPTADAQVPAQRSPEPATAPSAAGLPDASDGLPRISRVHPGRYVITDVDGQQIGRIYGDYVVGFVVECWDMKQKFDDFDRATAAIADVARARTKARLSEAS